MGSPINGLHKFQNTSPKLDIHPLRICGRLWQYPIMRTIFLPLITVLLATPVATVQANQPVAPALPVIPDKTFDITSYGAVGDGVATNTAAIQAAIDAA